MDNLEDSERHFGVVAWFSPQKGYGFVTPSGDQNKSDIFLHFSQIVMEGYRSVEPGSKVSFLIGDNHRGPMCADVRIED